MDASCFKNPALDTDRSGPLPWKESLGSSKQPLTAGASDRPYRTPLISVEALATDVSIFTNEAAAWMVQTGRPDQPSHSMRLR